MVSPWFAAMNHLEQDVLRAWASLDTPMTPVDVDFLVTPSGLGPVPHELQERRDAVLKSQGELMQRMQLVQADIVQQLSVNAKVPALRDTRRSVFLDVAG